MAEDPKEKYRSMRQVGLLTSIPFLLLAAPLVGYGLGALIDRWLHSKPWGADIGVVLGLVAGVREVVLIIRKAGADDE